MKMKFTISIAACGALIGAALILPVATATPGEKLEELLPITAMDQSDQDQVPEVIDLADLNVTPQSVRRIGTDGIADYWVGSNEENAVCLLAHIPLDDWIAGSSCVPVTDFYRSGLGLGLEKPGIGSSGSIEAYLLPEDVAVTDLGLRPRSGHGSTNGRYRANFVSVERRDSVVSTTEVARSNGGTFHFTPLAKESK